MSRAYYVYWYRLKDENYFLIYISDEKDGFVVDINGFVPSFRNKDDLKNYATKHQIAVDLDNPNLIELDSVKDWLKNGGEIKDYNPFINAWNLFEDISASINGDFDKDKEITNGIYNKIFWGCNISAVTPEGESFTPTWTEKDLKIIRETLNYGFNLFDNKVKKY